LSYAESWGEVLGRTVQPRCKICVDGVGGDADISVGDLWDLDRSGAPAFAEGPGHSVLIARTPRGRDVVDRAIRGRVLEVEPVTRSDVVSAQPLQVARRESLAARMAGKVFALRTVPRYRGYRLGRTLLGRPVLACRAFLGMWLRTVRAYRGGA
jgi:coenzyme F420 hydrogenase subunit beta